MTGAAKEAGNLCAETGNHRGAVERYTLALVLDADNIAALSNRVKARYMVRRAPLKSFSRLSSPIIMPLSPG